MPMPHPFVLSVLLLHLLVQIFAANQTADGLNGNIPTPTPTPTDSPLKNNDTSKAANSTTADTTASPTSQLAKPPQMEQMGPSEEGHTTPMAAAQDGQNNDGKARIVTRQSPATASPMALAPDAAPFAPLKPESKDEMFTRIDTDGDNAINLQDYMNRDRFYVESVRTEFNDIDTNRDGRVTKGEFDSFVRRLDEQRRDAMMNASNFTLQKNDANKDGELGVDELGAYINGTLQRSVAQLPWVFRQFDKDGNGRLNLEEFHDLDFNFPWEKFPPAAEQQMPSQNRQVFFNANGPVPPPFMNDQAAAAMPQVLPQQGNNGQYGGGGGGAIGPASMPLPQPVRFFRWAY